MNDQVLESSTNKEGKLRRMINSLGPGVMMATAAVGGSHLVASTKAGAMFGWQLVGLILLVNLLKYPFFRAGVQYTMGTGKSLIQGYSEMGKGYLWLFTVLSFFSAMVNTSALLLFSASLLSYFVPFDFSLSILSGFVAIVCLVILLKGHFKTLDALSKIIMATLVIATVSAVIMAAKQVAPAVEIFEPVSVWTMASVGFIVITMGWMPAPIEISSFTSLWLKRQSEQQVVTNKSALFDFNVGYFGSAILAIVFLALGALVFYGTDIEFKSSGIAFSHQLVSMYSSTIGEWSRYLIAIIAFFCIFGSTITVIDGYSRIMLESTCELSKKDLTPEKHFNGWVLFFSVIAVVIVSFFVSSLMAMLNFAMILAFMTTPIFALLNYQLLKNAPLPDDLKLGRKMKVLSIVGLTYLFSFLALFIYWKWMM